MNTFINNNKFNKKKVVFIMGATGMGNPVSLLTLPPIFEDKLSTWTKCKYIRDMKWLQKRSHTLRNKPDSDFTIFCLQAIVYIENILKTQHVPIMVGGPNLYIEKIVEDPVFMFKYKYDTCVIWIDVEQSVLNRRVDMRVDDLLQSVLNRRVDMRLDEMVNAGLVDEVRQIFILNADYTKGI
ncbi:hypothetical protein H5410_020899 [Solanum commersonii]|uniref:Uncharacterized protein n=1 Tax=Solanum commersonii TaxID=4109 RepID=A0A9J5ZAE5_SOLCO|nr:hypothetical protein H5410_020899 [Solanum commersonii]